MESRVVPPALTKDDLETMRFPDLDYVDWAVILGVLALLIPTVTWFLRDPSAGEIGGGTSDASAKDRSVEAWTVCKDFVEQRLSAPSTANFPDWDPDQHVESRSDQKYSLKAYVDAENKLGGTVRTDFICTVRWLAGGEWRLLGLDMRSR